MFKRSHVTAGLVSYQSTSRPEVGVIPEDVVKKI
jgi:hypothetical protein